MCWWMLLLTLTQQTLTEREYEVIAASLRNDLGTVERLLNEGVQVENLGPALINATAAGQTAMAKVLVLKGVPVNVRDSEVGWTPVMRAAGNGDLELFEFLVEHGADLKMIDYTGTSCLIWAASNGHMNTVRAILDLGIVDVNLTDSLGQTALKVAKDRTIQDLIRRSGGKSTEFAADRVRKKRINELAEIPQALALGKKLYDLRMIEDAFLCYQKAYKLSSKKDSVAALGMAMTYNLNGKPGKAKKLCDFVINHSDQARILSLAHWERGLSVISAKGNDGFPEAEIDFVKAVEIDPSNAFHHYALGEAWLQVGKTDRAVEFLVRALELQPGSDFEVKAIEYLMASGETEASLSNRLGRPIVHWDAYLVLTDDMAAPVRMGAAPTHLPDGSITLEVAIDVTGKVMGVRVMEAEASMNQLRLQRELVANVREWTYQPASQNGQPVPVRMAFKIMAAQQ